jgi:predicted dehydrogenase
VIGDLRPRGRPASRAGDRPVRIAVIGLGYWGPNLVRNLHELSGADVAWACDLRAEALAPLEHRYPTLATTTRFDNVLEDPETDAVAIVTPVGTHYELAAGGGRGRTVSY